MTNDTNGQERPHKRPREEDETAHNKKRHPLLFFDDGNIILASQSWLFCVHKSILKLNLLEDMIHMSHPDACLSLPLAQVEDPDEEIEILLRTIYCRSFDKLEKTDIHTTARLLRISTKYGIESIRKDVMQHLSLTFPSTLRRFDDFCDNPVLSPFLPSTEDGVWKTTDIFLLLKVASETHATIVLSMLFHDCALFHLHKIHNNIDVLSKTDAINLLVVRSKIITIFQDLLFQRILDVNSDCDCSKSRAIYISRPVDRPEGLEYYDNCDWWKDSVCKGCWPEVERACISVREDYWNAIPEAFGLGAWQSIIDKSGIKPLPI